MSEKRSEDIFCDICHAPLRVGKTLAEEDPVRIERLCEDHGIRAYSLPTAGYAVDWLAAHKTYGTRRHIGAIEEAEPDDMYSCCVLADSFPALCEANKGTLACAGHNISCPSKLPNHKTQGLEHLSQPCCIALAGVAPLPAMFACAGPGAPSGLVLEFLQRMWLASFFGEGLAALHASPKRAHTLAGQYWCMHFVEIANKGPRHSPYEVPSANSAHSTRLQGHQWALAVPVYMEPRLSPVSAESAEKA
ncbi:hypothetical protein AURDEDRAFT_174545 [Auricularia subglabra TFB-10046 SS5]|uniref:Uncharacterized protein n=1 Tax=Auricularia subglabra (strain TFB-10046 / SS5) TaxID=717982 RepID=J0WT10_AURST|nr:hypothetical protein AURDEDRAFT_174545 [Auricularia subglabra TFB-10046 SS5]